MFYILYIVIYMVIPSTKVSAVYTMAYSQNTMNTAT